MGTFRIEEFLYLRQIRVDLMVIMMGLGVRVVKNYSLNYFKFIQIRVKVVPRNMIIVNQCNGVAI